MVDKTRVWQDLKSHSKDLSAVKIKDLFKDSSRLKKLSFIENNILFDFSKQKISEKTLELLFNLLKYCKVEDKIKAMFKEEKINHTENRAAFHVGLREDNPKECIKKVLEKMELLVNKINSGEFLSATGHKITEVVSIGIGGSDLGPRLVCNALDYYKNSSINLHFISNIDGSYVEKLLSKIDPNKTLVIVNSKSFSTIETLSTASILKEWLIAGTKNENSANFQMTAVTSNKEKAINYGILEENIFEIWDWVGGRYSVWSAVGLPIAISIGMENFRKFLEGANLIDHHLQHAAPESNIPMIMALVGIWNINFLHSTTLAVNPYLNGLEILPQYLQQLEMESNGKSVNINDKYIEYHTSPVIWGGVGCNNQHAYMQLLHQGTQVIPVDFIASVNICNDKNLDDLMFASCIGQSEALMSGNLINEDDSAEHSNAKSCIGDKPSTTILMSQLTPSILGSLIALYEHKTFIQGVIWQIQSFDQWGVELGKNLIKDILPSLSNSQNGSAAYSDSTKGLIDFYKNSRKISF